MTRMSPRLVGSRESRAAAPGRVQKGVRASVALRAWAVLAGVLALSGCIRMHPTRSGFLSDYSQLQQVDRHDRQRVAAADMDALDAVDSFYIEPIEWLADDLGQPSSSPQRAEEIRTALYEALVRKLAGIRPIVDEPGPATARVRAAVTGVQESKPFANLLLTALSGPVFNGAAAAEIEILDPTGTQIVAESVAIHGHDWDFVGFYFKNVHPKKAVQRAAGQLAGELQPCEKEGFFHRRR